MISLSRRPRLAPVIGLALLGAAACHGIARHDAAAPSPATSAASSGAPRVSDEHVAGVALMLNNIEVSYALLAGSRAADADVARYAARMRTDHTSLNATLTDLLARWNLDAEDDRVGLDLRDAANVERDRLRRLTGRAFDVAYVDADVASHRELLDVIDRVLLPSAGRRELHDYVAALRPAIAAHLAHAQQLRATLAARRQ